MTPRDSSDDKDDGAFPVGPLISARAVMEWSQNLHLNHQRSTVDDSSLGISQDAQFGARPTSLSLTDLKGDPNGRELN